MSNAHTRRSVVVGIDGSQAALAAAQWAVDEAVSRDVPLRLIHVIPDRAQPEAAPPAQGKRLELEYGEAALRSAAAAVAAVAQPVTVETVIERGSPVAVLIAESRHADMVCVGSVGIGRFARGPLGSTAAELARSARCPVAIIRGTGRPDADSGWIVVSVQASSPTASPDADDVIAHAMEEAQRRHAPVLAIGELPGDGHEAPDQLDSRLRAWGRRYPGVHVYPVGARTGITEFLAGNEERVQLAVIGSSEADQVGELIGQAILGRPECSVLVVRS
ncbi:universal stress protein [Mycobacterium sp. SM1]|uniref:universal stress protein n=1 Tax=Mycobacterium sp. SM1 TaxID=2816243 RepID=UPI001BCE292A|nr:universal stress protein [Mycobacterium sp. SM1]MBS4729327.1 universal stress protein [Mycobacterium sp. SM1]